MKKSFEQPELMVVRINKYDVIATSETLQLGNDLTTGDIDAAGADRFRDDF